MRRLHLVIPLCLVLTSSAIAQQPPGESGWSLSRWLTAWRGGQVAGDNAAAMPAGPQRSVAVAGTVPHEVAAQRTAWRQRLAEIEHRRDLAFQRGDLAELQRTDQLQRQAQLELQRSQSFADVVADRRELVGNGLDTAEQASTLNREFGQLVARSSRGGAELPATPQFGALDFLRGKSSGYREGGGRRFFGCDTPPFCRDFEMPPGDVEPPLTPSPAPSPPNPPGAG